jgi:hypothetical protein
MSITSISLPNLQVIRSSYVPKSSNFAAKYDNAVSLAPPNYTVAELMTSHVTKGTNVILLFSPLDLILIGCPCDDIVSVAAFLTGSSSTLNEKFPDINVRASILSTANSVNTKQKLFLYLQGDMVTNIFSLVNSNASLAYREIWKLNLSIHNQTTKTDPFNLPLQKTIYTSGTTAPNTGSLRASDIIPDILENLGFRTTFTLAELEDSTTPGVMQSLIELSKSFRMLPYYQSNGNPSISTSSSLDDLAMISLLTILSESDSLSSLDKIDLSTMYVSYRINLLLEMNAITFTSYDNTILTTNVVAATGVGYRFTLTDIILFWMVIQDNKTKFEDLKLISSNFFITQGVRRVVDAGMPISMLKTAGFSVKEVIDSNVLQGILKPNTYNVLSVPRVYNTTDITNNSRFSYTNLDNMFDASNAFVSKITKTNSNKKYLRLTSAARIGALNVTPDNSLINSSSVSKTFTLIGSAPASGSEQLKVTGAQVPSTSTLYNYNFPLLVTSEYLRGPNSINNTDLSYVNQTTGINGLFDMNSDVITGITNSFTNTTDSALNFKWNPYKYYFGDVNLEFTADTAIKTAYNKAHICKAASNIIKDISNDNLDDGSMNDLLSIANVTSRIRLLNKKVDISNSHIDDIRVIAVAKSNATNKINAIDACFNAFQITANSTIANAPKSHNDLLVELRAAGINDLPNLEDTLTQAITNVVESNEEKWLGSFYAGFDTDKVNFYLTSNEASNDIKVLPITTGNGSFENVVTTTKADASFNLKINSNLIEYINTGLNENNFAVSQSFSPNVFLNSVAKAEAAVSGSNILPTTGALSTDKSNPPTPLNNPQSTSYIDPVANSTLDKVIKKFKAVYSEFSDNNIRLEYKQSSISLAGKYNFVVTNSSNDSLAVVQLSAPQQQQLKDALIVRFLMVYLNPSKISISEILSTLSNIYNINPVIQRSRAISTTYNSNALKVIDIAFSDSEIINRYSGISISQLKNSLEFTPFRLFTGVTADVSRNVFNQVFLTENTYDASNVYFNEPWKKSNLFSGYSFREMLEGGYTVAELNKDFNVFSLMFGSFFQTNDISSSTIVTNDMGLVSGAFGDKSFPISYNDKSEKNLYVEANAQLNGLTWYELIEGGVTVLDNSLNCNTLQGCMNLITSIAAKSYGNNFSQAQIEVGEMVFDISGGTTDIGKQVFKLTDNVGQINNLGEYSTSAKGLNFLKYQSRNVAIQTFFNILSTSLLMYIHALPDNITELKNLQINYRDISQNLVTTNLSTIDGALKYFNYLAYSGIAIGVSGESNPAYPTMASQYIEIESLVNLFIQMQYPASDYALNKQYFPLGKLLTTSIDDIQIIGGFIQLNTTTSRPTRRMMYMTETDRREVIRAYYPVISSWTDSKKLALATYTDLLARSNAIGDIENRALALESWYNTNSA